MASSGRKLVLVTGANGFIAARTCEAFLEAGYDVRGTVRSVSSGGPIQEVLNSYVKSGRFEIVIVPDITEAGAFDKAVEGGNNIHCLERKLMKSFRVLRNRTLSSSCELIIQRSGTSYSWSCQWYQNIAQLGLQIRERSFECDYHVIDCIHYLSSRTWTYLFGERLE